MTSQSGPLYEVTVFVAPDIAGECERRIEDHVRRMLSDPAVVDCVVYSRASDDLGRARRVCLHTLSGDDVIDDFIDGPGGELEAGLHAEFGDAVELQTRVLREDPHADHSTEASANCLNCGARLRGQYCGSCGQRSRSRLISLWELLTDAFGDLFEIDSRLWQTVIPLLTRPGRLTHDYLQGKRARFMPPFRMYLVLSVLFFIVAFFDPQEKLSLFFEPEPGAATEEAAPEPNDAASEAEEVLEELRTQGIIVGDHLPEDLDTGDGFNIQIDGDRVRTSDDCHIEADDLEDMPGWMSKRLTPERLQRVCERTQIDDGKALFDRLIDEIPTALFVLLPLMAFVLKALYPLSKRYYVEHLLFFVHFHAFFFLMLTLQILLLRFARLVGIPDAIPILTIIASSFYIAIYLFVAMRRVYGQGRIITFLKYIVLLVAYLFGFTATMLGALAIAAFSI